MNQSTRGHSMSVKDWMTPRFKSTTLGWHNFELLPEGVAMVHFHPQANLYVLDRMEFGTLAAQFQYEWRFLGKNLKLQPQTKFLATSLFGWSFTYDVTLKPDKDHVNFDIQYIDKNIYYNFFNFYIKLFTFWVSSVAKGVAMGHLHPTRSPCDVTFSNNKLFEGLLIL